MSNAMFELATGRLRLRPLTDADRPVFERFVGDPEMMRYVTSGQTWPPEKVDDFFARQRDFLAEHDCCVGALLLQESGEMIGVAGIQPLDQPGVFELAWWVWKDHWGRGYATEIAHALLRHAFEVMRLSHIVAIADPPNRASIRIMEKLGMRFVRRCSARETAARRPDVEVVYYALDNPALV